MALLLGIDIGTSSVKSVLFDPENHQLLAVAGQEYPLHRPQPGYAEQNPEDWWQATIATIQQVMRETGRNDIVGIGYSGQMHGTLLLDTKQQALHPAIIWADQRSAPYCEPLLESVGHQDYVATTGTRPAAGFLGPTLLWLQEHQPHLLEKAAAFLLPKDYIRLRMTGNMATDVTDAAGTGLLAISQAKPYQWAQHIIEANALPRSIFPPLTDSFEVVGQLIREAADVLGLSAGIPVVAGSADQPAQAIGNGIIAAGRASITVGSGGQVFLPVQAQQGALRTDSRLHVFNHAAGGWYALGAILAAGLCLRWLRDLLGMQNSENAYAIFSTEAAEIPIGSEGLVFLPYLYGERTPHMDSCARGAFIGLAAHHTRGHMARAVMEGVSFAIRQSLEICEAVGQKADTLIVSGGGMESVVWRQMMTNIIARPLRKSLAHEQAGIGAAMLAGVGLKRYAPGKDIAANFAVAQQQAAQYDAPIEPDAAQVAFYQVRYEQFIELYSRLHDDFHRLSDC